MQLNVFYPLFLSGFSIRILVRNLPEDIVDLRFFTLIVPKEPNTLKNQRGDRTGGFYDKIAACLFFKVIKS